MGLGQQNDFAGHYVKTMRRNVLKGKARRTVQNLRPRCNIVRGKKRCLVFTRRILRFPFSSSHKVVRAVTIVVP